MPVFCYSDLANCSPRVRLREVFFMKWPLGWRQHWVGDGELRPLLLPLLVAMILSALLVVEFVTAWPHGHIDQIRALTANIPLSVWQVLSTFGDARLPLAIALLLSLRERRLLVNCILALIIGWLVTRVLKTGFDVPRPGLFLPHLDPMLTGQQVSGRNSFPSSHAMVIFSVVSVLAFYTAKKWAVGLFGFAALVALSRVGIGAHWPADVLAGSLVGVVLACGAVMAIQLGGYAPSRRVELPLMLVVATIVATAPWVDSGYPHTFGLRLAATVLAFVAIGLRLYRHDGFMDKKVVKNVDK